MILNKKYERSNLIDLVKHLDKSFRKDVRDFEFKSNTFIKATYLGKMESVAVDVIEVEVEKSVKNRVEITKEAYNLLKSIQSPHAIISFFTPNGSKRWRLSLLTTEYKIEKGKIIVEQSNPKRYSYLLGEAAKVGTPTKYLIKKGELENFDDLKSRFSIEVVNKEFYESISLLFTKLVGGTRNVSGRRERFQGLLYLNGLNKTSIEFQEFSVRLIGRLLFAWFLKEKKSVNDLPLISNEVLSIDAIKESNNYYNEILETLFFEVLNTRINHRRMSVNIDKYNTIPYLNGGLFNPHDNDYYDFNSSDQNVYIPNEWFIELFELFNKYNFTVDENTSFDVELSVDPEMLGRIFENLLAEINPETGETARKSTGSFYTPRHVVEYMADQSLNSYLRNNIDLSVDKIDYITSEGFGFDDEITLNDFEKREVIKALRKVKIIDPACGSGAFPIGVLQKIVHIVTIIDPKAELWNEDEFKQLAPEYKKYLIDKYEASGFNYPRKLQIIRESIFGVDIQPIATEISRLRCFLTLIVDEVVNDHQENRGIQPLPNLEFKFVTANSLARLEGQKKEFTYVSMFNEEEEFIEKLQALRNEYFVANSDSRSEIQREFIKTQREMQTESKKEYSSLATGKFKKLIEWNPFSDEVSPWLDTEWMFGVDEFDIVIQNPPYVSNRGNSTEVKKMLNENYSFQDDLYNHFIHRGMEFLKSKGILMVISSDTYFTIKTKENLRELISNHKILSVVSLGYNVFKEAMVSTAILVLEKSKEKNTETIFIDAIDSEDIESGKKYIVNQSVFDETINKAIFIPNETNMLIHNNLSKYWDFLNKHYAHTISTSRTITKYRSIINDHIEKIKPGRHTLLGLVTDGGQGLATANNGKYVGVLRGTKQAERAESARLEKLNEFNFRYDKNYKMPNSEKEVWNLFDSIKEKHGKDVFGRGFLYRIIDDNMIADLSTLTEVDKKEGIANNQPYFVPYEKGDQDGNRWLLDNPFMIGWSRNNVNELKENAKKSGPGSSRYQNPQFYFKEGICYSDINTHYIKARIKPVSVHDVKSMSLFSTTDKVPNYYIITLLNSSIVADIIDSFINNTQTFQINDARFLPIPVPSEEQLKAIKVMFDEAVDIQDKFFTEKIDIEERNKLLNSLQEEIDETVYSVYNFK